MQQLLDQLKEKERELCSLNNYATEVRVTLMKLRCHFAEDIYISFEFIAQYSGTTTERVNERLRIDENPQSDTGNRAERRYR